MRVEHQLAPLSPRWCLLVPVLPGDASARCGSRSAPGGGGRGGRSRPGTLTRPPTAFEAVLRGCRRTRGRLRGCASGCERHSLPLSLLSSAAQMCSHIWIKDGDVVPALSSAASPPRYCHRGNAASFMSELCSASVREAGSHDRPAPSPQEVAPRVHGF